MTITDTQHQAEDAAAHTRRTGHYPPHWTADRCATQDGRIRDWTEIAARGHSADSQRHARRMLRRWGAQG